MQSFWTFTSGCLVVRSDTDLGKVQPVVKKLVNENGNVFPANAQTASSPTMTRSTDTTTFTADTATTPAASSVFEDGNAGFRSSKFEYTFV